MKRLLLCMAMTGAVWAAACSGGGSGTPPPPPPPTGFTDASLTGTYVFSMTGTTVDNTLGTSSFSRVGTFIADGKGGIAAAGGIDDVHIFGADTPFAITGGNYKITTDGRGTLSLIEGTTTINYNIALASSSNGYLVDMISDDSETGSGTFTLQSATSLANGTYVFDFAGIAPDGTGNPASFIGDFVASGAAGSGSIGTGSFVDVNEAGNFTTKASISGGTYTIDNANPGTGRGTAVIGGLDFVYYVIDSQHAQFMGSDNDAGSPGTIIGEAIAQQAGTPNTVSAFNNSSFVFVMGGSGQGVPFTRGGRLTATSGNLSSVLMDTNNNGTVVSIPLLNNGTISLDGDNSGRGVITFKDTAKNTGTYTFIFYLSSATQGVVQEVDNANIVEDGAMLAQTGAPFSMSGLAKSYAFNWSGVDGNGNEHDFVGSFATAGANPNGMVDHNEFNPVTGGKLFLNNLFNGAITIGGDGTGSTGTHSTFVGGISGTPSSSFNYFAYIANPNTILLMGGAPTAQGVIAGVLTAQAP
ncbi:MAG TPA: hypothetical protein VJN93_12600 [Candidatus Acidoferrum sp.]|nr:hypothetical protein [Candidatus Acidoferrum sp.]